MYILLFFLFICFQVHGRVDRVLHVNPALNHGEDECKIYVKTDLQPLKRFYGTEVLYRIKGLLHKEKKLVNPLRHGVQRPHPSPVMYFLPFTLKSKGNPDLEILESYKLLLRMPL